MTRKLITSLLAAAVLIVTGTGLAQVDDRARELLEGLSTEADFGEIHTIEQKMVMNLADMDMSTTSHVIIDYDNERAAIITETMGMEMVMRFIDGSMSMVMSGMVMPLPPGSEDAFDGIFEDVTYDELLDYEGVTATYDGVVSYADVLTGHQVSYSGNAQIAGPAGLPDDASDMRFIFDDAGNMLGTVVSMGATDLVSINVGEPLVDGIPIYSAEMYEVSGDEAKLFATVTYELIRINEPIDESLFQ